MNKGIIIQARTGSTRLPDKIIIPFYDKKSILELLINRILESKTVSPTKIVIATTIDCRDDCIASLGEQLGVSVFRGAESDVLERFIMAAQEYKIDKIIRICSDNLFIDLESLKHLYNCLDEPGYDYCSFITSSGVPSIKTHSGFFMEGVTLKTLCRVRDLTVNRIYHEHVTNYIYEHPDEFNCKFIPVCEMIPDVEKYINLRLTTDTELDFVTQNEIYTHLVVNNLEISPQNIFDFLNCRPDIYEVMRELKIQNSK